MLVGMSIPISNPRQADLAAQYRPKDTTAPKPSRLDALMRNYLRSTPQVAQAAAETNIFNPFPSVTEAVGQARCPNRAARIPSRGRVPRRGRVELCWYWLGRYAERDGSKGRHGRVRPRRPVRHRAALPVARWACQVAVVRK